MSLAHLRIAADVGGTFTDIAIFDEKSDHHPPTLYGM